MIDEWVEGETAPREYQLSEGGAVADLTGLTMTIELTARDGTLVDTVGDVVIVGAETSGQVRYTPDANDLKAMHSPLSVRFRAEAGGAHKYFPKGTTDKFIVRKP